MAVKKDKTGWIASYRVRSADGSLKRTTKRGLKTKSEAMEWERTHKHTYSVDTFSTFSDMFEEMSSHSNANETTTSTRRNRLIKYFPYYNKPITRITRKNLQDFRSKLRQTDLATKTVNDTISYVKMVFRYAEENYDITDISRILKAYPKNKNDSPDEIHIITPAQFKELISYETDERCAVFFTFLYMTGCRKGEARALYKSDYDPIAKTVHITKSMRRYEDSLKDPKNRQSIRYVPIDDNTANSLNKLLQREGKYLFNDYTPIALSLLQDHFKADLKAAGLDPNIRIHDLRHSHVSLLWYNGVSVPEISRRIGHSSPKVTMERYAHIFDNQQSDSLAILNRLFI